MQYEFTGSLVAYKNPTKMLEKAIKSFLDTELNVVLYFIDHSPTNKLKKSVTKYNRLIYIHNPKNPGFGAGHNYALDKVKDKSPYHLFLNPDIYFENGVNEKILKHLYKNPRIGLIMPQVVFPNGELQRLTRLLPRPIDYFVRRIIPISFLKEKINYRYEMRRFDASKNFQVPFLSGCYLIINMSVLDKIKGFDENFFMYCEDNDLCRSVLEIGYENWYYSEVKVVHDHVRKSTLKWVTLKVFAKSMIYYFNKWGWFFDKGRNKFNKKANSQVIC